MERFVWLTDTHLKFYNRYKLLNMILDHNPRGVFLTGDISEGFSFLSDLKFLGAKIGRPLYFVHGNHELWGSSFEKLHKGIRELCAQYPNLIWMTDAGIVPLNEDTAIIGDNGWFDCRIGNSKYIKYTFDWFLIKDFRELSSMEERIAKMREIADESADALSKRLNLALSKYKKVYLLSHFPGWREAYRAPNWINDKFYESYNTNFILGKKIEEVVSNYKDKNVVCLMGHTHMPTTIYISNNIECRVGKGSYNNISQEEILFI